ncbi:MAG: PilZ domain-containing protein [Magnetococcales bacterium]|nr:PilZ domain-containing protein [Magnetococcales bacterium]
MSSNSLENKTNRDERISFRAKLRFEADRSGIVIVGETTNVSMSGAFLESSQPLTGLNVGDEGVVFVETNEDGETFQLSFHCVISRIKPNEGVAFDFESEEEDDDDDYYEDDDE